MGLFFPHFHFNEVPLTVVQRQMCCRFRKWGLPRVIKADNGKPFGDPQRASVPELALWLIGLGIKVNWCRISTPKDNAIVERMQRTTAQWAEPQHCQSLQQVQQRLQAVARLQQEKYPLRKNHHKTRKQLYEALWRNKRRYGKYSFDVKRVYAYLQKRVFVRRVGKSGYLSFYGQQVYVGTRYKKQELLIVFNRQKGCWNLTAPTGERLGYFAADNFCQTAIKKLKICRPRSLKVVQVPDARR